MVAHLDATAVRQGTFHHTPAAAMNGSATPYRRMSTTSDHGSDQRVSSPPNSSWWTPTVTP